MFLASVEKWYLKNRILFWVIFACGLQNLMWFSSHYLGVSTFPWDFPLGYHAVNYFLVESLRQGVVPEWVPIQGMGYPMFLNLQSYVFYPPFYLFALFGKPFTLHAATVMQCLHVLFSGGGAYVLFRRGGFNWKVSLIGALGYQFFGGFLSNSEHPDIVRAFSILPWLLAAIQTTNPLRDAFTVIVLPLMLSFLWLGGYPGTAISFSFLLGVILIVRFCVREVGFRDLIQYVILLTVGLGIATAWILPGFLMKGEIARLSDTEIVRQLFSLKQFGALIQPIHRNSLDVDISMRSIYLGLPLFVCLFFVSSEQLKKYRVFLVTGFFAVLMATGSYVYLFLSKILFPLGLSRFPVADYRAYIYFVVLFFSVLGFDRLYKREKSFTWKAMVGVSLLYLASYLMLEEWVADIPYFISGIVVVGLLVRLLYVYEKCKISSKRFLVLFCALIFFDALRVHVNRSYWVNHSGIADHKAEFGDLKKPAEKLLQVISGQAHRPERNFEYKDHEGGFRGYLTGDFMVSDYSGPMQFKRQKFIIADPVLLSFAESKWCNVSFRNPEDLDDLLTAGCKEQKENQRVTLSWYDLNGEIVRVSSPENFDFVENELFFPGWSGEIVFDDGKLGGVIMPTEYKGFRHWRVPAGDYLLKMKYKTPGLRSGVIVSLLFLVIWMAFIVAAFSRKKTDEG